jgi:hypothetical protein
MPTLIPVSHDPFNDPPTDLIPVDHDPFDPLAASAGVAPTGTPRIDQIDWGQPSWGQQAAAQSQRDREAYAHGGVPEMMRDTVATQDLAGGFGGGAVLSTKAAGAGIRAFHGSPHDFERFDMSKIGTGEGAQAYGHGLYFAENPEVINQYRAMGAREVKIGDETFTLPPYGAPTNATPAQTAAHALSLYGGDKQKAFNWLSERREQPAAKWLSQNYDKPVQAKDPGHAYEVNIAADPEHFLDWDKPLNEQHPKVQEKLATIVKDRNRATSEWINSSPGSEQRLREAGIPGIKYLDQGSRMPAMRAQADIGRWQAAVDSAERVLGDAKARGAKNIGEYEAEMQRARNGLANAQQQLKGTSNYVVFSDDLIKIIRKYGLAGLIAGGAAHFSTQQVDHDPFATQ